MTNLNPRINLVLTSLMLMLFMNTRAQNGSECYSPLSGIGTKAYPVSSGLLCVGCPVFNNINYVTDADKNNAAVASGTLGVLSNTGIAVVDSLHTYPSGFFAGYVIDLGSNILAANVLSVFTIQTYNNGILQQTSNTSNGLSVSLLSGASGKVYLSFKTAAAFDEVRFIISSPVSAINTLRVYYAMAFNPNCGVAENNTFCYDQFAGPHNNVNYNGGLLNVGGTLSNPSNITDGSRNTYATLTGITNLNLLSAPVYVGVTELEAVYPGGHKAGFVIGISDGLLTADVMNNLSVQTYLHGQLQESQTYNNASGLLKVSALSVGSDGKKELSFTTSATKPFNEVRLVINPSGVTSVSLGDVKIYYAFESDPGCGNCQTSWASGSGSPYDGSVVSRDRDPDFFGVYNTTGIYGVTIATLTNTANVTTASTTDYATFNAVLGLLNTGARITVKNGGTDLPANTMAGFAISGGAGLLNVNVLTALTIRLYKDGGQFPVQTITGASLLNLGLLEGNSGPVFVGGKATVPFDEIELDINQGLLAVGLPTTYRIYYAYTVRDDDNDGVADCVEVCGSGNDAIDSDGDGIPDACDACTVMNTKSSLQDKDNDGISDACDADSDNDGITDNVEDTNHDGDPTNDDTDGDGIANYLDPDSDNDGIPDLQESGISSALLLTLDANNDGIIDSSVAKGANGYANILETTDNAATGMSYTIADTDGDGVPDHLDLDSDNDGINDIVESGKTGVTDANNDGIADGPDADYDGIMDSADGFTGFGGAAFTPADTDSDGAADYRDLDSDNDTINDIIEGGAVGAIDADANGVIDGPDTDGDGIMDSVDGNLISFGDAQGTAPTDTDNDGTPDYRDTDSNNNGIKDITENSMGSLDTNGDGMVDNPTDPDHDGIPNNGVDAAPSAFGGLGKITVLRVKALLQGALIGTTGTTIMRDDLRQKGYIPTSQPYTSALSTRFTAYGGGGNETTNSTVLAANAGNNDAIVDWVFLELRSSANASVIIHTVSALIQKDGDIVGADGNNLGVSLPIGNFFISIKHRNHLGAMTAVPVVTSGTDAIVDFSSMSDADLYHTAGFDTLAMKTIEGKRALWAGNCNYNSNVKYDGSGNDRSKMASDVINYPNNTTQSTNYALAFGYFSGDVNMNGIVKYEGSANDRSLLANVILSYPPNLEQGLNYSLFIEQLP